MWWASTPPATTSAENIGFAIAIDSAKDTISVGRDATRSHRSPTWASRPLTVDGALVAQQDLSVDQGAYVVATTPDGPAGAAGISAGDVILGLDGQDVASPRTSARSCRICARVHRSSVVVVGPSGDERTIDVTLGSRPIPAEIP